MDRALSWFFHVWVALAVAMNLCVLPSLPLRAAEKNTQLISDAIYLKPQRLVEVEPGRRLNVYCLGHGSPTVIFDSGLGCSLYPRISTRAITAFLRRWWDCWHCWCLLHAKCRTPEAVALRQHRCPKRNRCKLNAPAIV
jgi:hypothetical protein